MVSSEVGGGLLGDRFDLVQPGVDLSDAFGLFARGGGDVADELVGAANILGNCAQGFGGDFTDLDTGVDLLGIILDMC